MTQAERRIFLIKKLLDEAPQYRDQLIPHDTVGQKKLLRSLLNVRPPYHIGEDFLTVQDVYLSEETARKGITDIADLMPIEPRIYLWHGNITTLKCGAIVNAANEPFTE